MNDNENNLTPGIISSSGSPGSDLAHDGSGAHRGSVIARPPGSEAQSRAYGVALRCLYQRSPIIMLVSTATALVRSYSSYKNCAVRLVLNGLITVLLAILMIPGYFHSLLTTWWDF